MSVGWKGVGNLKICRRNNDQDLVFAWVGGERVEGLVTIHR